MLIRTLLPRSERGRIVLWLLGCATLLAALAGWGVRAGGFDRLVRFVERRWALHLDHAQELVEAGQFEQAVRFLERLDRDLPVTWIKHANSHERERLLRLLGRSYLGSQRKRKALAAFRRLTDFDPRNWRSRFELAEAYRHVSEPELARASYADVLTLHPSHLPSVEALITMEYEAGRFAGVPPLFESYLDAWLLAPGVLRLGTQKVPLEFPVDGREHLVDLPVTVVADGQLEVAIETGGYSVRLRSLELVPAARVGVVEREGSLVLAGDEGWTGTGLRPTDASTWVGVDGTAALRRRIEIDSASRARVWLTAYKPLTPQLWELVESSYRNLLDEPGLQRVAARSLVGGFPVGDARFISTQDVSRATFR